MDKCVSQGFGPLFVY